MTKLTCGPDKGKRFPLAGYERLCFLKNLVSNPKIEIGDYTYYDDFENVENFEKNVKYLFDFSDGKLIIGKFCMIASDVKFIMNGANHLTEALTSYPFAIFGEGWEGAMDGKTYPSKGDLVVGNDVWIGYNATLMAGITVGHGAIIAANAVVTKNVDPYTIVGGNPAREIRKRFTTEKIDQLLKLKWWDWDAEKITANVHNLTGDDLSTLL
jgi:virginiamycin A acetyltransferase